MKRRKNTAILLTVIAMFSGFNLRTFAADNMINHTDSAFAVTQVFGDGLKLTGIAKHWGQDTVTHIYLVNCATHYQLDTSSTWGLGEWVLPGQYNP